MTEREKVILDYIDAYNRFDVERMLINMDQDIKFANISSGVVNMKLDRLSAFEKAAIEAAALFLERTQTITSWLFEEERITVGIHYHAILATNLPNGLKKGDELNLQGQSIFRFVGNRIIEITDIS
jgi:hypothetical protein